MKKIISLILGVVILLSVTSCTPKTQDKGSSQIADIDTSNDIQYVEQYPVNTGKPHDDTIMKLYRDAIDLIIECSYITAAEFILTDFPNCTIDYSQILDKRQTIDGQNHGYRYYKTNLTHDEVKEFYGRFYSGELLEQFLNEFFYEKNNDLYVIDGSGPDPVGQENIILKYLKEQDGKYYYQAEFDKVGYSNYGKGTNTIVIEAVNGGYRICKSEVVPIGPIARAKTK